MRAMFYTNKGCVRKANEDALFVGGCTVCGADMAAPSHLEADAADTEGGVFCVIDGMGGYAGGQAAARITAQAFAAVPGPEADKTDKERWLAEVLQRASEGMRAAARRSPEFSRMGATLAGAVIDRDALGEGTRSVFTFNVGDCRVYRFRSGLLDKLTHDHSRVQELFDRGEIAEEEMRSHSEKNIVTAGIMASDEAAPEFFCRESPLRDGDRLFACSDGVWEALSIDEMEGTLSEEDPAAACAELQRKLLAARCGDNVSFVFIP